MNNSGCRSFAREVPYPMLTLRKIVTFPMTAFDVVSMVSRLDLQPILVYTFNHGSIANERTYLLSSSAACC